MAMNGGERSSGRRLFAAYMLLVSMAGYGLLAYLLAMLVANHQSLPYAQIGYFLVLALLVGLQPVRLPWGGATVR